MSDGPAGIAELGPNAGLIEEMYRLYQDNPQAVAPGWREFFEDYVPRGQVAPPTARPAPAPTAPTAPAPAPVPAAPAAPAAPAVLDGEAPEPLRGAAARIVANMEASLAVPTATSVRSVPAKLLEVNRQILNNHLGRTRGGKVSFTHLIGYAVLQALPAVPNMNSSFGLVDGKPAVVRHDHVNLGIAIDLQKDDGSRTLLVPNIKAADTLSFAEFHAAYEEIIRKARTNKLGVDDFAGTTISITNPGTIGTMHSVPRLMPGQGLIVGVGAINFPIEYEGADPQTLADIGVSKIVTLTSTYDHRVIQGAESGEFLARVHALLLGEHDFYRSIFSSFDVPYEPAKWDRDHKPTEGSIDALEKPLAVMGLINMYRVRGHLIANLDPLGLKEPRTHEELDPLHWGLTIWDLDREFPTGGLAGKRVMKLRDILGLLRDAYSRSIGVEYMHIQEPDEKEWIQREFEGVHVDATPDDKRAILAALNAAEAFERFLHTKYLGQKRFSLEGAETLIPMLGFLLDAAADAGMEEVVMGMAHRGRLNVLANIVNKSYGQIFREFEGELDPNVPQGSGDVKYHVGATGKHTARSGATVNLTLAANPSHLEAVDPVVEGIARAMQDRAGDTAREKVLSVLIHGDAAVAGQGVVAETLNLSELPGYDVGGTVHVVVNNQVGFTTAPGFARSSVYATDVAKAVQAPIFHVNGDDPEAAARVIRVAFEFRQVFKKDVVVDMICYRRYGHNEGDEPAFTQPRMYELIGARRSVRKLYTETLVNRGDISLEEAEAALEDFRSRLEDAFVETQSNEPAPVAWYEHVDEPARPSVETGVARDRLDVIVRTLTTFPEGISPHPKLERILKARRTEFDADRVDWALAESLAFGTLLQEGVPVRLAGQDTRRGTFSQRHTTIVDHNTETEYTPLANLPDARAPFMIYDSVLSEFAALGFEYGYSVADRDALVAWEAQFGDFVNGGQTIIDQFIVAAEDKWGQRSGLVMLLPHGFEGQGPEHSSARMERFLVLCAEDNMRVVYPTTAAQYFHALRRQVHDPDRKPLIVFTPKRYLRMPVTASPVSEFVEGSFRLILPDPAPPADVRRLVFCTGKFGHELLATRDAQQAPVAIARLEQLYPWPEREIAELLDHYHDAEVIWAQEEPGNMGARYYTRRRIEELAGDRTVGVVARAASPSPATGSSTVHEAEQAKLLEDALSV
ncbi:MAG: multifunctional oxoglutarate decarboxylase/oxoglutarate dehydrogenase thiamine pyrophosphate-binding subunit/dihydrolipoyllysine-residue succinyltransferase subunit [Acidimicrobiia bacterium]